MAQLSKPNFSGMRSRLVRTGASVWRLPTVVVSVAVSIFVVGLRQQGLLETLELGAYDQMVRLLPEEKPDPRLLVVAVTEADIQTYKNYPITDGVMQQLLTKLLSKNPRAIGLDIYRDLPVEPGHAAFSKLMSSDRRIVPVCAVKDAETPGTPPPPKIADDRAGFADIGKTDSDGVIRRGLLFVSPSAHKPCPNPNSFGFQLVQRYLEKEGIEPTESEAGYLKIKNAVFKPLQANDGGYIGEDTRGYQILLNYRAPKYPAKQVTMSQVLNGQVDENLVKDRIVLIGVTASSVPDAKYTPYSAGLTGNRTMPGVVIHAQLVSQILSASLDGHRQFWFWAEWGEALWVVGWSVVGGLVAFRLRHPGHLALAEGACLAVLSGTCWLLFTQAGWVPVVPPALALVMTGAGVMAYNTHQAEKEHKKIALLVREQQNNLLEMQALLKEKRQETLATGVIAPEQSWALKDDDSTAIAPEQSSAIDDSSTAVWEDNPDATTKAADLHNEQSKRPLLPLSLAGQIGDRRGGSLLAGRYKTVRGLASGGFGHTYLAEDIKRPGNPLCVIKHLMPAHRDEKFLQLARRLFHTEAEILEQLGHHPQIPQLLAYFEENQEFYLVEEFVKGHPLSDELPVDKRLPEAQVAEILYGILETLAFIHENYVIHRDIKPSNIIRREKDNKLFLIDFGAVKQMQPQNPNEQENLTVAIGTKGYTPPEQYKGKPNFSSDIYAVGIIGIEALTGISPQKLSSDETCNVIWRDFASVQEEFANIIDKMVRYHFLDRYQTTLEVLNDLKRLKDSGTLQQSVMPRQDLGLTSAEPEIRSPSSGVPR